MRSSLCGEDKGGGGDGDARGNGASAGYSLQVTNAIAIGASAGNNRQKFSAIAIGASAGVTEQQQNAIANLEEWKIFDLVTDTGNGTSEDNPLVKVRDKEEKQMGFQSPQ